MSDSEQQFRAILHNHYPAFLECMAEYSMPHRMYHCGKHMTDVLWNLIRLAPEIQVPIRDRHILALMFHDVVYDPKSKTNEMDSADWAEKYMQDTKIFAAELIVFVRKAILATIAHNPTADKEINMIIDCDLLGFASPPDLFRLNTDCIRAEYRHLTQEDWVVGREAFLGSWLRRDRIFATDYCQDRWGEKARANIERELNDLVKL